MKPPKEPKDFRFPRMYVCFSLGLDTFSRLRIIEPDGRSNWLNGYSGSNEGMPCWAIPGQSAMDAVKSMKEYDLANFLTTVFIGEIKMQDEY